jgi:hypothetical protein
MLVTARRDRRRAPGPQPHLEQQPVSRLLLPSSDDASDPAMLARDSEQLLRRLDRRILYPVRPLPSRQRRAPSEAAAMQSTACPSEVDCGSPPSASRSRADGRSHRTTGLGGILLQSVTPLPPCRLHAAGLASWLQGEAAPIAARSSLVNSRASLDLRLLRCHPWSGGGRQHLGLRTAAGLGRRAAEILCLVWSNAGRRGSR